MVDIAKRRADRLLVMKAIFDASQGSESMYVSGPELLDALELTDQELGDACTYLEGEGLIETTQTLWGHLTPYHIQITHRGILEMEQSLGAPEEPTQHFPPAVSIINVGGSVIGSAIQSGSPGAHQEVKVGDIDLAPIRDRGPDHLVTGPDCRRLRRSVPRRASPAPGGVRGDRGRHRQRGARAGEAGGVRHLARRAAAGGPGGRARLGSRGRPGRGLRVRLRRARSGRGHAVGHREAASRGLAAEPSIGRQPRCPHEITARLARESTVGVPRAAGSCK